MPYTYLEEIGTADIAFEATGRDLPELFRDAADATIQRDGGKYRGDSATRDTEGRTFE